MSNISFRIARITKEMAVAWLAKNTGNRKINRGQVEALKRDILAGRWIVTHQGIAFGTDGRLMDGQHRLTAIAECGVSVEMLVFGDLPLDAAEALDGGQPRDLAARVTISGEPIPKKTEVAAVSVMRRGFSWSKAKLSTQEQLSYFREHIDLARDACALLETARTKGISRGVVAGVVARALASVPRPVVVRFCEILTTGITGENPADATVIALRDFLMNNSGTAGAAASMEVYRKTARALDAFRKGERLGRLFAASSEPFPIPSDRTFAEDDQPSAAHLKAV